jgi:hypothetical protein
MHELINERGLLRAHELWWVHALWWTHELFQYATY